MREEQIEDMGLKTDDRLEVTFGNKRRTSKRIGYFYGLDKEFERDKELSLLLRNNSFCDSTSYTPISKIKRIQRLGVVSP